MEQLEEKQPFDVIVIGAGAAGMQAHQLRHLGPQNHAVTSLKLDRGQIAPQRGIAAQHVHHPHRLALEQRHLKHGLADKAGILGDGDLGEVFHRILGLARILKLVFAALVDFFGGEPLMNWHVVQQTVTYVRQQEKKHDKKIKMSLTTNGMLLDKEKVKYLTDNHISLILSLDGRKEMHDSMRPGVNNEGTYDRIMKNLQYCIKHRNGEEYYVRGTFTRQNLDFTTDVEDMLNHGFPAVSMEPVVGDDTADYSIKESDLPRVKDEYDKLAKFFIKREEEGNPFFFFHFNMDLWRGPCLPKRLRGCGAGHEYLAVVPNGDIYPCHQFVGREGYVIGNVFEGLKNMKMMRDFRVNHVFSKPECVDCWAKFFCSGGCHANNEAYAGDIHKPYGITCEIQKKRVECAMMIQAYNKLKAPKVMHQPGTKAARKAEGLSAT